ncbi:MAG TPA: biosynthetic peptidoglycan transglycosylase, partial [Gaiellaceae bacterium]|nr:biosynthetic peptidoglycan transglycosylase [Gaiellaceae bacterium]
MDVRRGGIDAELHAQRPTKLQLRLERALGEHVDRLPRQVLHRHGATLATVLALFRRKTRAPKRRRIRKLRLLALLVILGLLGLVSFTFGFVAAVASELPDDPLKGAKSTREANTYIYAHDGKTVLSILRGDQARILVRSDEISPRMKHAIVAVEDRRFYEHRGVDLRGIGRAVWADIRHKGVVEGGSTITQQFVKNSVNENDRTISRKLREAALAWQLEQRWKKERILTAYLNTVYFGNGAYGVEQASR